jgi:hypothetical protein
MTSSASRRISVVFLSLALLGACASDPEDPQSAQPQSCQPGDCRLDPARADFEHRAIFTQQEQAVYAHLLGETFHSLHYVLSDHSASWDGQDNDQFQEVIRDLSGLSKETLASFLLANGKSEPLPADLELGAPYTLIDRSTFLGLVDGPPDPSTGFWSEFFAQFPEAAGLLTVAHVGFDAGENQALVFLRWRAGPLAMSCTFFLLERDADTWNIVGDVITVIS